MNDPRKVDVAYADGHWLAEVAPDYDEPLECSTFQALIDAVQRDWPDQTLVFVVDQPTVEGHVEAEDQLLEASEKSGALIVSSDVSRSIRQTFNIR